MENLNNQGRSPEKYKNSAKAAWYAIVGMIVLLISMTLFGGCSTTKKVDECCSKKESIKYFICSKCIWNTSIYFNSKII